MSETKDEQLMIEFSKGSQRAFAELYGRHKGALYRYFVRQFNGTQNARAEEMFQEVWYRVVDKRETYKDSAKFTTWLYHIAHNLMIDEYRKRMSEKAYKETLEPEAYEEYSTYDPEQHRKLAIKHCVTMLPPHQREAFLLKHESGFELSQVSEIVDAKPEAIKSRLRYAMDQLRQCLTRKLRGQE